MEDFKMDKFQKLYAMASAQINSIEEVNSNTFEEEVDFDNILTLSEFKKNNSKLFKNKKVQSDYLNYYYIIPVTLQQRVRNGNEEILIDKKANILTDPNGYALFVIMDNGIIFRSAEFDEQLEIAEIRYKEYLDGGAISKDDIREQFEVNSLDEAMELIENQNFTLPDVQRMIDEKMKNQGIIIYEDLSKPQGSNDELGEERLEPGEELELLERRARGEASILGISPQVLEMIAERYSCRIDQISFRLVDDYERFEEDTGLNLRMYRGKVVAVRVTYGYQQKYYAINSETGAQFNLQRGAIETGEIPELADYFTRPSPWSDGRENTSRSLTKDSSTYRSYITTLDSYGNVTEAKYINNGKDDDMVKEERQRYIAEVREADEILQDRIDVYQKDNTQENWLRVKDAMDKRILVDKKYRVLERQKENTIRTLDETIDETLDKYGPPKKERNRDDEEDEWFERGRH